MYPSSILFQLLAHCVFLAMCTEFNITCLLRDGFNGKVYKGITKDTSQLVVIKTQPFMRLGEFFHEYSILWELNQKSINVTPQLTGCGPYTNKGEFGYAMAIELCAKDLGSILDLLKEKKKVGDNFQGFTKTTFLEVARQQIKLLGKLHEAGYVHRDVKPDNFIVLLDSPEVIRAIDLGMGYDMRGSGAKQLNVYGTLNYMSFNAHDSSIIGTFEDWESLFFVLVHFCLGEVPWECTSEDEEDMWKKNDIVRFKKSVFLKLLLRSDYSGTSTLIKLLNKFGNGKEAALVGREMQGSVKYINNNFSELVDYLKMLNEMREDSTSHSYNDLANCFGKAHEDTNNDWIDWIHEGVVTKPSALTERVTITPVEKKGPLMQDYISDKFNFSNASNEKC